MALHYLLDGYNIIKQVPSLVGRPWEDGRASLVKIIETEHPQGSNRVTIIFDGWPGRIDTPNTVSVEVIFSCDASADDRIKKIIAEAANKKSFVVVTDDRDIQYYVRSLGAKVVKVSEFLSQRKSHQDKRYSGQQSDDKQTKVIPLTLQEKITSELEKIWLGKKKDKNS